MGSSDIATLAGVTALSHNLEYQETADIFNANKIPFQILSGNSIEKQTPQVVAISMTPAAATAFTPTVHQCRIL